jgi:hypothetical protein
MRTKSFDELLKQMTPEQRAESELRAQLALLYLILTERQKSLDYTEDDMGKDLGVIQSALSELENQDDIQVSTLSRYIKALGGSLKLVAQFPDKEIVLAQFE